MNKKELVLEIVHRTGTTQKEVEKILNCFCDVVGDSMKQHEKVQLVGFGSFEVRERSARKGKNPKTGEIIEFSARKNPTFKAGKALKDKVNHLSTK